MKDAGFHLIEILIVLAIISILSAFYLPSYLQYLVQERRLEAETMLSKLAIAMEQYQIEQNTYQQASLEKLHFSEFIVNNNYKLTIQSATDFDYVLAAMPLGKQEENDKRCGTLLLYSTNAKAVTGYGGIEECW